MRLSTNPLIVDLKNLKHLKKLKMVGPPPTSGDCVWGPVPEHKVSILPDTYRHLGCQDRFEDYRL